MGSKLYVGNLSYDTTEDKLRAAFAADGRNVARVTIPIDRETGRPRGFAFVEMGSDRDAQAAIEALNGTALDGRTLRIDEARERTGGFAGGGGGGSGGGGGGGGGRAEGGFSGSRSGAGGGGGRGDGGHGGRKDDDSGRGGGRGRVRGGRDRDRDRDHGDW